MGLRRRSGSGSRGPLSKGETGESPAKIDDDERAGKVRVGGGADSNQDAGTLEIEGCAGLYLQFMTIEIKLSQQD